MNEVKVVITGRAGAGKTVVAKLMSEVLCKISVSHEMSDDGHGVNLPCADFMATFYDSSRGFEIDRHVKVVVKEGESSVLMSSENHDGWKLEELLDTLITEVDIKTAKIEDDDKVQAQAVVQNNEQICGLLRQAAAIQRKSFLVLATIRKEEGPSIKPRIGEKS